MVFWKLVPRNSEETPRFSHSHADGDDQPHVCGLFQGGGPTGGYPRGISGTLGHWVFI